MKTSLHNCPKTVLALILGSITVCAIASPQQTDTNNGGANANVPSYQAWLATQKPEPPTPPAAPSTEPATLPAAPTPPVTAQVPATQVQCAEPLSRGGFAAGNGSNNYTPRGISMVSSGGFGNPYVGGSGQSRNEIHCANNSTAPIHAYRSDAGSTKTASQQGLADPQAAREASWEAQMNGGYSAAWQSGRVVQQPQPTDTVLTHSELSGWLYNWQSLLEQRGVSAARVSFEAGRLAPKAFSAWATKEYAWNSAD